MEVWPDLFGRALLVRHWGRIGTAGRRRLDPHPDQGAAINALARLAGQKRRRGYRDRLAWERNLQRRSVEDDEVNSRRREAMICQKGRRIEAAAQHCLLQPEFPGGACRAKFGSPDIATHRG
jgi:predicted DNA-binding WGR domain protein